MVQKCNTVEGVFFAEPTQRHYLKEISRKANLAHTSVKNHLEKLEKQNIITKKIEKKGKRKFPIYLANINNPNYKKQKIIYNLEKLLKSGLIDAIADKTQPNSIVLFGSYLRGEDLEDSDIDIFVEAKEKQINLKKYEKELDRKIQLHFKSNLKDYPAELKNNIINGLSLHGAIEIF